MVLALGYWLLGEGLGGISTGSATDPSSGPLLVLLVLLAVSLYPLAPTA
jgi:hypothetical protein